MPDYRIIAKIDPSGVVSGGQRVKKELNDIDASASRVGDTLKNAFGAAALAAALVSLSTLTTEFADSMAEVSTLVDTATFDMEGLTKAARDQAKAFASTPKEQAKALYQIISAGASSAAQATQTLTAANKLAVGGVTDVKTAADGLTSVLNAYGPKVESAAVVSDLLFVAMKSGKTTIGELSANIGKVAPLAAQAGVSFAELTSSISALTKGGVATAEAVTGVRAIMAAIVKPTDEASKLAAKLGIDFSAAGLKAKGFAGFLEDLREKTKGNTEQMATLFSGVEALVPILSLTGSQAESFAQILDKSADSAGAAQEAFDKMAASPGFQIGQLIANITDLALGLGLALGQILVPALQFVNANFTQIASIIGALVAGFVAYRAAVLLAAAATFLQGTAMGTLATVSIALGRQYGVLIGLQTFLAGSTAGAAAAFRVLSAAIIASPLAPLAIALTAAGAAYLYFTSETDAATAATNANAAADQAAMEFEAKRAFVIADLANTTAEERAQTVAATRAAIAKASADIGAAKAALKRAIAERELAASIVGRQALVVAEVAKRSPIASLVREDTAIESIGNFFGQKSDARRVLDAGNQNAASAAAISAAEKSLERTKKLADEIDAYKPPAAFSSAGVGDDAKVNKAGRDAAGPTTSFADIENDLKKERELLQLVGIEREVRAEQLAAEDQLNRKLLPAENAKIRSLVEENDALARLDDFNNNYLKGLNDELDLLGFSGDAHEKRAAQLQAENILGRQLTETEQATHDALLDTIIATRKKKSAIDAINGPVQDYRERMEGLNAALQEGAISQAAFTAAVGNIGLVSDLAGVDKDLGGDFAFQAELDALRTQEAERLAIVEQAKAEGLIQEQEYQDRLNAIRQKAADDAKALEDARKSLALTSASETFDSLASISKDFFGEQSAIYKATFAISKAFAIADSIIKIQQGIANALSLPFPANILAAAGVASQAASIVSNIRAVSLAFADGGLVRGPGSGTSDSITANLSNGEYVVNAKATGANLQLLESINSGRGVPFFAGGGMAGQSSAPRASSSPNRLSRIGQRADVAPALSGQSNQRPPDVTVPLKVVNVLDPALVLEAMATEAGTQIVLNIIESNPSAVSRFASQ